MTFFLNKTLFAKGLIVAFFTVTVVTLSAQVKFNLALKEDGETFVVSLISEKSWAHPYNITSTAQVTIKVPTNSFEVKNLTSLQLGVDWQDNSRSDSPSEAPGYDYISFGLSTLGTVDLNYDAGLEMPLFTFKNAKPCKGDKVILMSNEEDPFMAPNSRRANVGNSIAIFGARGEAYIGNLNDVVIPCQSQISTPVKETELINEVPKVYPNPALNEVFVELKWANGNTDGELVVMDPTGKEVARKAIALENGLNKVQMDVDKFPVGIYSIELQFSGKSLKIDRFVKSSR